MEQTRALKIYNRRGRDGLIAFIEKRTSDESFDEWAYLFVDPATNKLAGNLTTWPSDVWHGKDRSSVTSSDFFAVPSGGQVFWASYQDMPDRSRLLLGRNARDLDVVYAKIGMSLAVGVALFLGLAAAAALSTARRAVGRIEAINSASRKIAHNGLGDRIPLRGTRDEWDELAGNLNSMLAHIERCTDSTRQAVDNVAHDLRTPLARLRNSLEKAQAGLDDLDEYRALVGDAIEELDGILATFSSLLRLSRIEADGRELTLHRTDLSEVACEVVELFEPAAEEVGVRLRSSCCQPMPIIGDRDLLFDAIANIVDNAIKHGGNYGEVTVTVDRDHTGPTLSVADRGPGIPPEECDAVLRRFYRLERSRSSPGIGLGLSLVAAVASVHRAAVELTDNGPGLKVLLRFRDPDQLLRLDPLEAAVHYHKRK